MREVKYIGADKKVYQLQTEKVRISEGRFRNSSWKVISQKTYQGHIVENFEKEPAIYEITVLLRGSLEEREILLNNLKDTADRDIYRRTPGELWMNGFYIKGFIISTESGASELNGCWSQCKLKLYCPNPFWLKETEYHFKSVDITSTSNKRYGYRYAYRYANGLKDTHVLNENIAPANFRLRIYGPCVNPLVNIGGHSYTVHTVLEQGDILEADSRSGTLVKTMLNGTRVNMFHYRGRDLFMKILPGRQTISWDGKFDFDLIIFEERSEPRW